MDQILPNLISVYLSPFLSIYLVAKGRYGPLFEDLDLFAGGPEIVVLHEVVFNTIISEDSIDAI